ILGQIVAHLNLKLPSVLNEEKTINEFIKEFKLNFKIDIKYSVILSIIYCILIYCIGSNVNTFIYSILAAVLMIVFSIDYRFCLIPDSTHIIIIVLGIINLCFNISNWYTYVIGAILRIWHILFNFTILVICI
ncbi:MAG: hypothetical protein RSF67_09105, partial [Clostridia bacterium]